jgi:ferric-dicitrate binding protein FerR (iron transport regulator)
MPDQKSSTQVDGMIAKLIAAAGPGPTASPEARARVYANVRAHWETVSANARAARNGNRRRTTGAGFDRRRRFLNLRTVGVAAAVAAVAVSLTWMTTTSDRVPVGTQLAQYTRVAGSAEIRRGNASSGTPLAATSGAVLAGDTLSTAMNGRVELRRPNGLLLRMNGSTEIRFSQPDEIDLVAGTIYVDSGNGAESEALEVNTPFGGVEHVGTQYEVRYADAVLRIRVREGQVAYRGATEAVGMAGDELNVDAAGSTRRSTIASNDAEWNWAIELATLPVADEYRLGETLTWIARELGYRLEYAPGARQRLEDQTILGLDGLNPAEALDAIELTAEFRTEISGDRLIVSN